MQKKTSRCNYISTGINKIELWHTRMHSHMPSTEFPLLFYGLKNMLLTGKKDAKVISFFVCSFSAANFRFLLCMFNSDWFVFLFVEWDKQFCYRNLFHYDHCSTALFVPSNNMYFICYLFDSLFLRVFVFIFCFTIPNSNVDFIFFNQTFKAKLKKRWSQ